MKGFTVSESIVVQDQEDNVLKLLWDIPSLEFYEPKVSKIIPGPENNGEGIYTVQGRFGFSKWKGQFSYRKTSNGFVSETLIPIQGNKISGGFVVSSTPQGTSIKHWEHYELAPFLKPLTPFLKKYISASIRRELKNIKGLLNSN